MLFCVVTDIIVHVAVAAAVVYTHDICRGVVVAVDEADGESGGGSFPLEVSEGDDKSHCRGDQLVYIQVIVNGGGHHTCTHTFNIHCVVTSEKLHMRHVQQTSSSHLSSHLSFNREVNDPLTVRVVGAPQMISQLVSSIFPCSSLLHCPLGLGEHGACPFPDVAFPSFPLTALFPFPFHCAFTVSFPQHINDAKQGFFCF